MSHISDETNETFLHGPSRVDDVLEFAKEILKGKEDKKKGPELRKDVEDFSFMVYERGRVLHMKKGRHVSRRSASGVNMNQMTIMRQINVSEEQRRKARQERIIAAKNFRRLGNAEFRKSSYDAAIDFYTKGINFISDSPVLYVNRSVCHIKKREYKRAAWDLEYVLRELDPCCVRALCCLAGVHKRLGNDEAYEHFIARALLYGRRTNQEYVENFIVKIKSEF